MSMLTKSSHALRVIYGATNPTLALTVGLVITTASDIVSDARWDKAKSRGGLPPAVLKIEIETEEFIYQEFEEA
tara:strand:+ start:426 stop:647 length:222 start_codon:yes stop_codon:yes gene_type:complete